MMKISLKLALNFRATLSALIALDAFVVGSIVHAIPASERAVLVALYDGTNGAA